MKNLKKTISTVIKTLNSHDIKTTLLNIQTTFNEMFYVLVLDATGHKPPMIVLQQVCTPWWLLHSGEIMELHHHMIQSRFPRSFNRLLVNPRLRSASTKLENCKWKKNSSCPGSKHFICFMSWMNEALDLIIFFLTLSLVLPCKLLLRHSPKSQVKTSTVSVNHLICGFNVVADECT